MTGQLSTSLRKGLNGAGWQDWGMFVLAVWLFISPWVFPYGETNLPGMSAREAAEISAFPAAAARVLASVLALLVISGVYRLVRVEKWLTLIIGVFIALAPWVFGATGGEHALAVANEVIVGLFVCLVSLTKKEEQALMAPAL